ncbi:MAG: NfeD family protein [Tissierellia bacterium]|nr:NfeD family protein [Tissierellia bacterium]
MKRLITVLSLLGILLFSSTVLGNNQEVLVIPIHGEINRAMVKYVEDGIQHAEDTGKVGIIFDIDTYGGMVVSAEKIKNVIINTDILTVSYVNNKAESAGVLLAVASEHMVMNQNSTIGSAEPIPNTEKNLSFWRSLLRDTAELRGKNTTVIEAMADSSYELDGITTKGKLVNLTAKESLDLGVTDKVVKNEHEILEFMSLPKSEIETFDPSIAVKLASIISNPVITTALIAIGMVAFVVEIFTPGFGVGGSLSILAFGTFFLGNILAGYSNYFALGLFILGLLLIVIEIFVPGFGLPGILGIISVVIGLVLAMESLEIALTTLAIAMIITGVVTVILIKKGLKSPLVEKITLNTSSTGERGYYSTKTPEVNVGDMGIAVSDLKPSGFISIQGNRYDALSEGAYIEQSQTIRIERIEGSKIFVRRV